MIIFIPSPASELESSSILASSFVTFHGSSSVKKISRFEALFPSTVCPLSLKIWFKITFSLPFSICELLYPVEARVLCKSSIISYALSPIFILSPPRV